MDIVLHQGITMDLSERIKKMSDVCRISKIEEMLSSCLENMPDESPINFVGELNKNDVMH